MVSLLGAEELGVRKSGVVDKLCPMPKIRTPFEEALLARYYAWGSLGYWAKRFYQKFSPHCKAYIGGVEAVRAVFPTKLLAYVFEGTGPS